MSKFELDADFSPQDVETILESLDSWEQENHGLLDMIDKMEKMGEPPADLEDEYRKGFGGFRNHILSQKEKAKKEKRTRRLTACRLKAKIIPEVKSLLMEQHRELSDEDLEALLDSLDGWEQDSADLLHMIDKLKQMGDPPETADEDYRKHFVNFRNHILSQEDRARKDKKIIRERATMLKAKVIFMQSSRGADRVFDEASKASAPTPAPKTGKMTAEEALAKGIINQAEYDRVKKSDVDPSES